MHQRTVLHMVSITSKNVELSGGRGGEAEQAAHAEQQWLVRLYHLCDYQIAHQPTDHACL